MGESICANISGPAFSLLLYENVRSESDQEGFLLGEVITKERRTITDNDQVVINIERIVKINSVIPCPKLAHFYNGCGEVDNQKLSEFLRDEAPKVVAWYKFKHIPSFKLTLREKIIIKQLASIFIPNNPEHFLCCLLTTQTGSETGATHLYSQTFVRYHHPTFQTLPMHIVNLKDPYDVYKGPEDCSDTFKNIVGSLKINTKETHGYTIVNKIEKGLDEHISKVVQELSVAEKKMFDLEREVKQLQNRLDILHDCGDMNDTFGIMENGVDDVFSTSMVNSPSASMTKSPSTSSTEIIGDKVEKRRGRTATANVTPRTTRYTTRKSSELDIPDNRSVRSYAQATQKNKT